MKKKTLVIGVCPREFVEEYLECKKSDNGETRLLVPVRDKGFDFGVKTTFFKGVFHPFFPPLLKVMLEFRPTDVVLVCGATYDHDNVVDAIRFYLNFWDIKLKITVRSEVIVREIVKSSATKELVRLTTLMLITLGVKLASVFKTIRVAEIYSTRLGHLAFDCDLYLSEKDLADNNKTLDLFYFKDNKVANQTLADLFSKKMFISPFYAKLHEGIRLFGMTQKHELLLTTRAGAHGRDSTGLMKDACVQINFSDQQNGVGRKQIKVMGLDPDVPSVCLLGRDSAYLQSIIPEFNDVDYQEPRNMDIDDFKEGTERLLELGYNVFRMGSVVKAPMSIAHSRFVDYAISSKQSDFMDIYLTSKCRFFVGVQSGLQHVAKVFRVPCVRVNVVRIEKIEYCYPEDLAMFKLLWSKTEKRILSVREMIDSGISRWPMEKFQNSDLECIDNSPDEISEAIIEMHKRLEGTWIDLDVDQELQERYRSYFKASEFNSRYETPIASYFLRKHAASLLSF